MATYSSWGRFQDAPRRWPKDWGAVLAGTSLRAASNFLDTSMQKIASDSELIVKTADYNLREKEA
jgi:hypothetical protein